MAVIATVSASAAVEKAATSTRPVITDVVNSDPEIQVGTKRYYFYMPKDWYNEKNDNYDGESLDSCAAGIYWWSTSYNSEDYKGDNAQGWPGFLILNNLADEGFPNIFYADVPEDAGTIIFDNTVDGGQDETAPGWGYNAQTVDVKTQYTSADDDYYGFYESLESTDNMIYVVNPLDTTVNEFSGATTTRGDWFYYYGEGKYGPDPVEGDRVFTNGDFPSNLIIDCTGTTLYPNDKTDKSVTIKTNAPADELQVQSLIKVGTTSDENGVETDKYDNNPALSIGEIKAIEDGQYKSQVTITGVQEADDVVVEFIQTTVDPETQAAKQAIRTCLITVSYAKPAATATDKSIYIGKTATPFKVTTPGITTTYKSSKTSVATVDKNGKVTGKAAGKATITYTAKAGSYTTTKTAVVTVKKNPSKFKVTAKAISAKSAKVKKTYQLKKAVSFAASKYAKISGKAGTVTYKLVKGKSVKVAKNGKMTFAKGLKKGKYTVKVKVTDAGSKKVAGASKTISVKFTVK